VPRCYQFLPSAITGEEGAVAKRHFELPPFQRAAGVGGWLAARLFVEAQLTVCMGKQDRHTRWLPDRYLNRIPS